MEGASSFGERVIISSARLCFEMEDKTYLVVNGRRGLALMFVNFWGMEPRMGHISSQNVLPSIECLQGSLMLLFRPLAVGSHPSMAQHLK